MTRDGPRPGTTLGVPLLIAAGLLAPVGAIASPPSGAAPATGRDAVATPASAGIRTPSPPPSPPPRGMMLASHYAGDLADIGAYWVSEKLDGVRARWDGRTLWTRGGLPVMAPTWFTQGWPPVPMDGELWIGRRRFDEVSVLARHGGTDDAWGAVRFLVFDLPAEAAGFEARIARMRRLLDAQAIAWLRPVRQRRFGDRDALDAHFRALVEAGAEGLVLHHRDAPYRDGRSPLLLKYKPFEDAEARVVAHLPGQGRHTGRVGALLVALPDERLIRLGSGLSDAQRMDPPAVGATVTFGYSGLTSTGLPRFARFLRIRDDATARDAPP
ncbi:DNA ligase [Luteimonas abyssi]|uniref:DNA ligase n=1 Tax=Luteimonas abyssi TaxID=1247514 RepID=UPI0009EC644B|nr:DNA ligase [Luteimonas abyssi]